ncbi:MAG TPA: guanine deaminase [Planctomycetota bacterium]|nr:guanine deaminase [Planctomycetota bacterium]
MNGQVAALWRATVAHVPRDPFVHGPDALEIARDGGLAIDAAGRVVAAGAFERVRAEHGVARVVDRRGAWILPGFVDLHVHFPQTWIVASRGERLLDWLERYVFPEEAKYADPAYARRAATTFFDQLVRNGTTTALAFGSHDATATAIAFEEAARRRVRVALGKTLHGRGAPAPLLDRPAEAADACRALIADWHGRGKARYAVTPRFALTSTPDVFSLCRRLLAERPDLAVTTHVAENVEEIALTRAAFPEAAHYVDVYAREGLLGPRTVLAHGVRLDDAERRALRDAGAALAHCPSSNFFLGSGVFDARATAATGVRFGLGTDVGAGTGFSLLGECDHAYKASALRGGAPLGPAELLYLATRAGAEALGGADAFGDFAPGKAADFVVVDPSRDGYLAERTAAAPDDRDALFALLVLARGAAVRETVIDGVAEFRADVRDDDAPVRPA